MRVIVAGRLSQLATDRDQTGFDSQESESVAWAERNGHEVIAVIADFKSGRSGLDARPNLRPWVTNPDKLAQYDGIVALKVDRLTRGNREETAELEKWAKDHGKALLISGADVHFPSEGTDGIAWDLMLRMAHQEWLNTSERYSRMQRTRISQNSIVGKPNYGYAIVKIDGRKTQAPVRPQCDYLIEAKNRYLDGQTLDEIIAWFDSENLAAPGKSTKEGQTAKWSAKTLSAYLRNPAYCGRRVNAKGETVHDGFTPLWSENDRELIVSRMDGRAHRKGISPKNVALLTSVIHDANGHPMYRLNTLYYCRKCRASVNLAKADAEIGQFFSRNNDPYLMTTMVVSDHENEIIRLRAERSALDDLADDYDSEHARITAEIRALAKMPKTAKPVTYDTGKTYGQVWNESDDAKRRDMMLESGFTVTYLGDGKWSMDTGDMIVSVG